MSLLTTVCEQVETVHTGMHPVSERSTLLVPGRREQEEKQRERV